MGKSSWKTKYFMVESASNFHNRVRDILCTDSFFKNLRAYQEVLMRDLVPDYHSHLEAVDWYIEDLNLILELHGRQHYQMTNFGDIGYDHAMRNFHRQQSRDSNKKFTLEEAGYRYIEISYKLYSQLDAELLKDILLGRE